MAWGTAQVLVERAQSAQTPHGQPQVTLLVSGADSTEAQAGSGQDNVGQDNVVLLIAHQSPAPTLVLSAVLQNTSSTAGETRLVLDRTSLPSWLTRPESAVAFPVPGAPAQPASTTHKYTYMVLNRGAAISQRLISGYNGILRLAVLSPPLPFPAGPTSRYLILPPSSILHVGVLSVSAPGGESRGQHAQQGRAGGTEESLLVLDIGASPRSSAYVGKILFVFLADGRMSAGRIRAYNGETRSAHVLLNGGPPAALSAYAIAEAAMHPKGVRMWLDGRLVLDEWLHVSPPADSCPVMLRAEAGAHLVLEYRQMGGEAAARLEWKASKGTNGIWRVIPSTRLFFQASKVSHPLSIL